MTNQQETPEHLMGHRLLVGGWRPQSAKVGAAPGTLVARAGSPMPTITVMAYGPEGLIEEQVERPSELSGFCQRSPVAWFNVDGLGDVDTLERIGQAFDIHRLTLEDILNIPQRPKVEEFTGYLFVVLRLLRLEEALQTEQVSLLLGHGWVMTFQEQTGDCFEPVRNRLRDGRGRARQLRADYLAYALIDAVVDSYFPVAEEYAERLEEFEEQILVKAAPDVLTRIHVIKRDLLALRRAIWPLRDGLRTLIREDHPQIASETTLYLRDTHDHLMQLSDLVQNYRDASGDLMDLYLSRASHRMNEIMKVLTIMASIFIPLSFVAGIYGMNFNPDSPFNMPELTWAFGYPFALALMATIAIVLLVLFRKKGWL